MADISSMTTPVRILLIEDNSTDVELIQEAMKLTQDLHTLEVFQDGVSALAFLRKEGRYADAPRPDFILLDLNLPGKSGLEVLKEVKSDTSLKQIPVAILTSSDAEVDVYECYDLHANCYLTKPWGLDQFIQMMRCLNEFWFGTVTLHMFPHDG